MVRNTIIFFLLVSLMVAGCASVTPKNEPLTPQSLKFQFEPGERFKTFDFLKIDKTHPDGKIESDRKSTEFRYTVIDSSKTEGAWLKVEIGAIEAAKLINNEVTGSAKATAADGIIKYKDGLDFSKDDLQEQMKQVYYIRVDTAGRMLARTHPPPPSSSLNVREWPAEKGFETPGASAPNLGDAAFCLILPQKILSSEDVWTHTQKTPLHKPGTLVEFKSKLKALFTRGNLVQISGLGDPTGHIEGQQIQIKTGRQFVQMVFDPTRNFPRNLQSETYVEYVDSSGKLQKVKINYTSNNTKVPRKI